MVFCAIRLSHAKASDFLPLFPTVRNWCEAVFFFKKREKKFLYQTFVRLWIFTSVAKDFFFRVHNNIHWAWAICLLEIHSYFTCEYLFFPNIYVWLFSFPYFFIEGKKMMNWWDELNTWYLIVSFIVPLIKYFPRVKLWL